MNKAKLKKALKQVTGCSVQHDGWPCGTCFYNISKSLKNQDWQNVLLIRGDYPSDELDNLPKDREKSYEKIMKVCAKRSLQHKSLFEVK
jgi:NDP-sugar pyrophosphorylase family protein